MKVKEMLELLSELPAEENVSVLYPEDHYGEGCGIMIDEITYLKSSSKAKNGVFIRLA